MPPWQNDLLLRLRAGRAVVTVTPYGSYADPGTEVDGWSDLDVALRLSTSTSAEVLLGGDLWAWQDTSEGTDQLVRLVLTDGRRVDAQVNGDRLELPPAPPDLAIRFDAALAASRLGRGNDLIGLHLVLGILGAALVQQMLLADRDTGTSHHRRALPHDDAAGSVAGVVAGPLRPESVLEACDLYAAWRGALEPGYTPNWSGVRAVIERGRRSSPGGHSGPIP